MSTLRAAAESQQRLQEKDDRKNCDKWGDKIKAKSIDIDSRFFIADNSQILFIISKAEMPNEEIAIWLNTPFFASSKTFMFDQAFKESKN